MGGRGMGEVEAVEQGGGRHAVMPLELVSHVRILRPMHVESPRHHVCEQRFRSYSQAEIAELSRREDEGVENSLAAVRQWEHDTAAQLLLPLPADVKGGPLALIAGPGGMGSGGGGLGTPGGPGGYGGGLGTPGGGGGMMGSSGGSSTSGVRGAGSFSFGSFRK